MGHFPLEVREGHAFNLATFFVVFNIKDIFVQGLLFLKDRGLILCLIIHSDVSVASMLDQTALGIFIVEILGSWVPIFGRLGPL